jgi:O-antigen/teichoic acid export membrane protein
MLSILNLGFGAGYIRYYAKYKRYNNYDKIFKLNGLFLIIFSIIGIVALVCGLFLSFNLEFVFDTGITSSEYKTAKVLMILLSFNLALSFPMSVFSSIISAHERFIFLKLLGMIKTVLGPLVTLPLLLMGYKSIAMVVVSFSLSLVTDFIYVFYVKVKLKNKFIFKDFEKGLFRSLFVYSAFIAINMIIDQINWNIDKLLLGRFVGTSGVAVYSVGFTLYNYYMMFSTAISSVFTPRIHNIVNSTASNLVLQKKELTGLFTKVGRIQFLILMLIASGLVFFGKSFISFWAGEGYEESYYVMLLLTLPASIALIQNLGIEVQRAQNKHQFRSLCYLIMAIFNLILSIFLCQKFGAVGCAIGTAISLIFANGFIMNIYYQKRCNINIFFFWKNILRMCVGLVVPIILGVLILKFVVFDSIILLIAFIVLYTIIYCASMWLLSMNAYEKSLVKNLFGKLFKRKK